MDHLRFLLLGLGNGGVYAALGLALVLCYRSSGVINFATGALALHGAYLYGHLREGELVVVLPGLPTSFDLGGELGFVPAVALAVAINAALGALLYIVVFRPLREAPPLARAVASLGVLAVLQSLFTNRFGTAPLVVDRLFPADRWELGSIALLADRFWLAVAVVSLTVALAAANRWTRFGLVTRAAAESQTGAIVSGIAPDRVALANWMIGGAVAAAAGILIAPLSPLSPATYTLFVVPALAAAVVGGFQNLVPTALAGLAIGMFQSEAVSLSVQHTWLPRTGSAELVPLGVVLVTLLLTGRGLPAREGLARLPLGRAPRPRGVLVPAAVGSVLGCVALAVTAGSVRSALIASFIAGILSLSFVVVTGYAGQVSVAQLALSGTAAFTLSGLTISWNVPFPLAPLLAALVTTVIGVVVSLPALRLRGLSLGVVTLALALGFEAAWFRNTQIVDSAGARVPSPELAGFDLSVGTGLAFPRIEFGLLCLAVLVGVAVGVAKLRTTSLGSAMLAVRANERSAAGIGVNVLRVKVAAFAISSFIAGLGGSLHAYRRTVVTFQSFTALGGLTLLSTAYLAGITSVHGGVLAGLLASGGVVFLAVEHYVDIGEWFPVLSGVAVVLTVIFNPEGMATVGHHIADFVARRGRGEAEEAFAPRMRRDGEVGALRRATGTAWPVDEDPVLEIEGLTVRYGGVVAVDNVSFRIPPGTVVGLIGPNGAGKTSLIDALTGFASYTGSVCLLSESVDTLPPHARVRRGLGRTFQALELYDDLTVEENIAAALPARDAGGHRVERVLDRLGIPGLRARIAGELSQGERQLVSIARACVAEPSVLLLDEPAAGLDTSETRWLGARIRSIADSGVGVLLVDHDVSLVLALCDHIVVLDFGSVIAEGPPEVIRADRGVVEAYLGAGHAASEVES